MVVLGAVKVIESISRVMNAVAIGALSAMILLTVADVFLRYVFSKPIIRYYGNHRGNL